MIPADLLDEWTKTTERLHALDAVEVIRAHLDTGEDTMSSDRALEVIETFIRKHT